MNNAPNTVTHDGETYELAASGGPGEYLYRDYCHVKSRRSYYLVTCNGYKVERWNASQSRVYKTSYRRPVGTSDSRLSKTRRPKPPPSGGRWSWRASK